MPLRSVEAATRDDAIAAAREQFGPSARVVGVRRVRSGGVLGFFATERYVAEVAADPFARPDLTAPGSDTPSALETTGRFASPLSGAAAATAAPAPGRASAPARNGAAAYAAAAGQEPSDRAGTARTGHQSARSFESTEQSRPREDDQVSELAGLFADAPAGPAVDLYGPGSRSAAPFAPRTGSTSRDAVVPRAHVEEPRPPAGRIGLAAALDPAAFSPDAPSPFTAALARMAAGDRDVRDAVEVALDQPRVVRGRSSAGSWPSRSGSPRLEDTSAPSGTTRQEEEPVGEQVVAPPSTDAPHVHELPNWAAEPAPVTGSSREEAIAEVLRSALAQGHSDEALAGILRKMLDGASPQTALADPPAGSLFQTAAVVPATPAPVTPAPAAPAAPMTMSLAMALASTGSAGQPTEEPAPEPVLDVAVSEVAADPEPSMFEAANEDAAETAPEAAAMPLEISAELDTDAEPADAESSYEVPSYEMSDFEISTNEAPADEAVYEPSSYRVPSYRSPAYESPLFDSPLFSRPASDNTSMWGPSVASIWGEPTSSHVPLWGEPVPFGSNSYSADLPIWDDVLSGARTETFEVPLALEAEPETADDVVVDEVPVEEVPVEAPVEVAVQAAALQDAVTEEFTTTSEDDVQEAGVSEPEVAELATVFARTASDPAPRSLDVTSFMPPLSLLPPLPGSRSGRGRPPVPPSSRRSAIRTTGSPGPRVPEPSSAGPDRETPAGAEPAAAGSQPEATAVRADNASVSTGAPAEPSVETGSMRVLEKRTPRPDGSALATVTRLPVATQADLDLPTIDLFEELDASATSAAPIEPGSADAGSSEHAPVAAASTEPQSGLPAASGTVAALAALGLPEAILGDDFENDVATIGTYAALTRTLVRRLPAVPELPTGAGDVLFVVGPGVETLRAARTLAAGLRLDPESVQWATRGDLAGLAPRESRVTTVEAARQRRESTADAGTVTIVAVDVPLRTDAYWMAQMLAIWSPVAVWAVVEATRKAADLDPWLAGLTTVDALVVTDTDLSGEPAAALRRGDIPVAVVDGARATAHRWASLLCERLETRRA